MADTIDVDKMKTDAFDAIDALFGEEGDEDSSFEEQAPEEIKPSPDEFSMLEEFSLALDWEYSDKEINRFIEYLNNIARKNPDKYNQALVKMLMSIISYLQKARNKAFPQTLNVMVSVINILRRINEPGFDKTQIKSEVSSAYQKVVILKQKISEYNEGLKKHISQTEKISAPDESFFESAIEPEPEPEEVIETIYSYELIDNDETEQEAASSEIFSEAVTSEDFSQSFIIEDDIAESSEPVFDFSTPEASTDQDSGVLARLGQLENKVAFLEKQNKELKRLVIERQSLSGDVDDQTFESGMEDSIDSGFDVNAFSADDDMFAPIEASEPMVVEIDDITYDHMQEDESSDALYATEYVPEYAAEEEYEENLTLPSDDMDSVELDRKEDFIEYVKFFMVGQQVVALPNDYINNIYKLPSNIGNNIHSMKTIVLDELSSVFQKLSKNMKGSLQGMPNNELKEINATIKILGSETSKYSYAVLCSCDDTYVIVPVTDKHKTKLKLATGMRKTDNEFAEYSVEIDGMGTIPLVIPC